VWYLWGDFVVGGKAQKEIGCVRSTVAVSRHSREYRYDGGSRWEARPRAQTGGTYMTPEIPSYSYIGIFTMDTGAEVGVGSEQRR
jgi:hypothetical protein